MTVLPGTVWDACTTLNVMATDRAQEILTAIGSPSYIVKEVREGEVFTLRPLPEDDPTGTLVPVDLTPLIKAEILQEVELTPAEQTTFIKFAESIDDGEARSAAAAVHRGLTLVTDDKDSIRLVRGLASPVPVLTTLDWMKMWVDKLAVNDTTLSAVLRRVEICAHYRPRRNHPMKSWWEAHLIK